MTAQVVMHCQCGRVACESTRPPMLTATCYCDDCQTSAKAIEASGNGPQVADPDGGSALTLLRLDGFTCTSGQDLLVPHKLREGSPTSRMVASCCNSAMFLSFADWRFWVSGFCNRIVQGKPEIEARIETRFRQPDLPWPDAKPRHQTFPKRWLLRILGQWAAMKLGR